MPLADPPRPSGDMQSVAQVVDYLIGYVRWFADFINHIDSLNVEELSADVINAGTLNAALVTIKSLLNAGAYIQIDGNGMSIFDGVKNTFIADITGLVTMTGALIKSASGYPRVEINGTNNALTAYKAAGSYVGINPNNSSSVPGIDFVLSTVSAAIYLFNPTGTPELFINTPVGQANIDLSSGMDLLLNPQGNLKISGAVGYSGSISYVKNVVSGSPTFGTITVTKGIITNVT